MRKTAKIVIGIIALAVLLGAFFSKDFTLLGKATETPKAYYLDEITDTAQKVKSLTKEPALVFFLCTDVHYNTIKTDNRLKLDSVTDMTVNMAANALTDLGNTHFIAKADTQFAQLLERITTLREDQQSSTPDIALCDLL